MHKRIRMVNMKKMIKNEGTHKNYENDDLSHDEHGNDEHDELMKLMNMIELMTKTNGLTIKIQMK